MLDILAFGAHPDDVELSCSGILRKHKLLGKKVGVVDLTEGELGSRGSVELRYQEAANSAKILELDTRQNLQLPDGFFENNKENQLKVITAIRQYRPQIVLINAPYDRHPDHGKGAQLVKDACFLSGLLKIETEFNSIKQQHWRPSRVFHYIQDTFIEPDIIVDISNVHQDKMKAIQAFSSQFYSAEQNPNEPNTYISGQNFLDSVKDRDRLLGKKIGTNYGEGLLKAYGAIGINDLFALNLPELV